MAIRISPGLAASLLTEYGLASMMDYGCIDIYTGVQPQSAFFAPSGVFLGRITTDGLPFVSGQTAGGLRTRFDATAGGLLADGTWRFRGSAAGTAGWWRWKWNSGDDNSDSLFYPRMDGTVGESLTLVDTEITPDTDFIITGFTVIFAGD